MLNILKKSTLEQRLGIILPFFIAVTAFIILRLPSLFEPHWYGDEAVYAAVAHAIEKGRTLYVDVWDNKPPGIYFIYMLGDPMNRLHVIRVLNLVAGIALIGGLYKIALQFKYKFVARIAVLGLAVFTLGTPILEGNIANAENFFMTFIVWGIYFALAYEKYRYQFISGMLFGAAFTIKFHPLFDYSALVLFMGTTILKSRKDWKRILANLSGFSIPIILISIYILLTTSAKAAFFTIFLNNVTYTTDLVEPLLSFQSKTFLTGFVVLLFAVGYYFNAISKKLFLIFVLAVMEFYGSLFSGREFRHYLIQTIPSTALLIGYVLNRQYKTFNDLLKSGASLIVVYFVLSLGLTYFYTGFQSPVDYTDVRPYYQKFENYLKDPSVDTFLYDTDAQQFQVFTKAMSYGSSNVYFHTDNPWIYDMHDFEPPIFFVVTYHQLLYPNGEQKMYEELKRLSPDVIAYDQGTAMTYHVQKLLSDDYILDAVDAENDWSFYVKR